jgi:transposase InsO family protein
LAEPPPAARPRVPAGAVRGAALGRKVLDEFASIVTPETNLRWHKKLVTEKWTLSSRQSDRRLVMQRIAELVIRMARENLTWGYDRIQGARKNLGHVVAPNTIKRILKRHGIDPAPERAKRTTWRQILRTHATSLAAGDFFSTEGWTARGLVTCFLCPARAPNCNAFAERFVRSIKSECLSRMMLIGPGTLRHALAEFVAHCNAERNHQGIGNRLIEPATTVEAAAGRVARRSRLGGLLNYCHRLAA